GSGRAWLRRQCDDSHPMSDARKLLFTRGVRGAADGIVSIALATYLTRLGFSAFEVGAVVTGTLLGSAAVTLAVGLFGYRLSRRRILLSVGVDGRHGNRFRRVDDLLATDGRGGSGHYEPVLRRREPLSSDGA